MQVLFHPTVYAGQQVRILGENYTLDDEEDSKIGQVCVCVYIYICQYDKYICESEMMIICSLGWSFVDLGGKVQH